MRSLQSAAVTDATGTFLAENARGLPRPDLSSPETTAAVAPDRGQTKPGSQLTASQLTRV